MNCLVKTSKTFEEQLWAYLWQLRQNRNRTQRMDILKIDQLIATKGKRELKNLEWSSNYEVKCKTTIREKKRRGLNFIQQKRELYHGIERLT